MIASNMKNWKRRVADRDNGICQHCGKPAVDPHHVLKRRYRLVKLETDNGISLCRFCHDWAEAKEDNFNHWFKENYPKRWDKINNMSTGKSRQYG